MLKQTLFKIVLIVGLMFAGAVGYFNPITVLAAGEPVELKSPIEGDLTIPGIIEKVIGVIFWLGLLICPAFIIWGGFEIATAGGDPAKIGKGKQIIFYAIGGLAIIALSQVLAAIVKSALGGD